MLGVVLVYAGLVALAAGIILLIHPVRRIGIRSRRQAAVVALAGLALVASGWTVPAPEQRIATRATRMDDFMPAWQFNEVHTLHVRAPPESVWNAIRAVRADEIRFFRLLTRIRTFGRRGPESILNAPERQPIIDVATRTTFLMLALEPPRELVVGTFVLAPDGFRRSDVTAEGFSQYSSPFLAKAVMNFRVDPDGQGGSNVSTETRVFATDQPATRAFARYWRIIYPGSAIIRREWLRAVELRATRGLTP
jgi:hypothetical protein